MNMRVKKSVLVGVCAVLCAAVLALAGCTGSSQLAEPFDKDTVVERAHEVVELCNAGDYDAIMDMSDAAFKSQITADQLEQAAAAIVEERGSFESFGDTAVDGTHDDALDADFARAVVIAQYSNGNIQYTLAFDTEMRLTAFFIK